MENIEKEIELIKERNRRVELDKAWETSKFRIISIVVITYLATDIVFSCIGVKNPETSALIPTLGYYLSTQSLSFLKKYWQEKHNKITSNENRN